MAYPETGDPPHLNPVNKDPGKSRSASHVNRQNERTVSGTKGAIVNQADTPKVSTTIEDKESILSHQFPLYFLSSNFFWKDGEVAVGHGRHSQLL